MAEPRTATLQSNEQPGTETRLLTFALDPGGPDFPYVPGKYIIVDTGLPLPDGKIRKRAYTLLSFDTATGIFQIAVRRVGPATDYLHALTPGQQIRFSGPWGKYLPHPADENETENENIWIIATDTGLTATVGLLQSTDLEPRSHRIHFTWFLTESSYFLPPKFVEEKLNKNLANFQILEIPPIHSPERPEAANRWLHQQLSASKPTRVYLSGDGAILLPWLETIANAGVPADHIHIETFFNHAKSKA